MTISTRNILPNFETFRCPRSSACNIFHLPNFSAFILLTYRFDNILELLIRRRRDGRGKKMKRKKNYNRNLTVRFNPPPPTLPSPQKREKKKNSGNFLCNFSFLFRFAKNLCMFRDFTGFFSVLEIWPLLKLKRYFSLPHCG